MGDGDARIDLKMADDPCQARIGLLLAGCCLAGADEMGKMAVDV